MIDVRILKAKETMIIRKNGTFLEGELYFGRPSKDGMGYVVRSEEGYWIPFFESRLTINRYWHSFPQQFESRALVYMRSRKRLNEFLNAQDYVNGNNCTKWWYTTFRDNELWR
jgi:hypothetical protein